MGIRSRAALFAAIGLAACLVSCGGSGADAPSSTSTAPPLAEVVTPFPTMPPSEGPTAFTSVFLVDANTGWLSGDRAILATTDGGNTWHRQYSGVGAGQLQFATPSIGWSFAGTILLRTTDAGQHWETIKLRSELTSVDFITPTLGRALYGSYREGSLIETTDGGRTWQPVASLIKTRSVCFGDPDHGWAVVDRRLMRTSDGGRSWRMGFATPSDLGGGKGGAMNVTCRGPDVAWALFLGGEFPFYKYVLYRTVDGGASWQGGGAVAVQGFLSVVDAKTAFAIGDRCSRCGYSPVEIQRTVEGRATWEPAVVIPGITGATAASFVDAHHGWVIGSSYEQGQRQDHILRTNDGGQTWSEQFP